jgi:hypothetical protein
MITGKLPFLADTPIATLLKHIVEQPRPPSELDPEVNPALEAICLRALKKAPADRFGSAREMRAALRKALDPDIRSSQADFPVDVHADSGPSPPPTSSPFQAEALSSDKVRIPAPLAELASRRLEDAPPAPARRRLVATLESVRPEGPRRGAAVFVVVGLLVLGGGSFLALRLRASPPEPAIVRVEPKATPPAPSPPPVPAEQAPVPTASSVTTPAVAEAPPAPSAAASTGKKLLPAVVGTSSPTPKATVTPPPTRSAPPLASAPPVPAASPVPSPVPPAPSPEPAPGLYDKASVSMGAVRAKHAKGTDVIAAMPSRRLTQCYRDALATHAGLRGTGTLHLVFGSDGHVGEASFAGPSGFESVGQCIAGSVTGINVRNVEAGGDGADGAEIDLAFKPE